MPADCRGQARQGDGIRTVFGLSANGESAVRRAERTLQVKAGVLGVFTDFTQPFPAQDAAHAKRRGAVLMISWEPQVAGGGPDQPRFALSRIIDGEYDAYIRQFARDARAAGRPVLVRFAAEMNGDWQVWSLGVNGNRPGEYADAFRHVVEVARAVDGGTIRWVFNPIVSYRGSEPLSQLYPGDAYVDWVGLDGYNWGGLKPWGWQAFQDVFAEGLAELRTVAPGKPLAIAEIGCAPGRMKPGWVTDGLSRARAADARIVVWFEHRKETDWRLTADPEVAAAARSVIRGRGWVTGGKPREVRAALGL